MAATEIGNNCAATGGAPNYTFVQLSRSAPGPPLSASSGGVVTEWKINVGVPLPEGIIQQLKVLRPAGAESQFTVVSASDSANVLSGPNAFKTRIPIQAGDRVGLGSSTALVTLYCATANPGDVMGIFTPDVPVGSTQTFGPVVGYQVPVSAIVEPDADNDGYGDETQDKCPQSATTQEECPVIVLDSFPLARKSSIVVLVVASEPGAVTVSGTAKYPNVKKAKSSAKASLRKVKKNVTPGKIARFTLRFPGKLKSALKGLPRGKKVTVSLQATAANVAGQVSKDKAKLKLRGRS
jgi:hypothetical protein